QTPDDQRYAIALVDEDQSDLSASLRAQLEQSEIVRPTVYTSDEAAARFEKRSERFVVTIPAGFGAALRAGQATPLQFRYTENDSRLLTVQRAVAAAADQVSTASLIANASLGEAERVRPFASDSERSAYF